VRVEYSSPEPNGLAAMLGGLIEANLERHPDRRSLLAPAVIELTAPDAGVSVTLDLSPDRVVVSNGSARGRRHHVRVRAGSDALLSLSTVPLRLGLPDPFTREGRRVLGDVLRGRIRISGLFLHPRRLARLSKLLSVA